MIIFQFIYHSKVLMVALAIIFGSLCSNVALSQNQASTDDPKDYTSEGLQKHFQTEAEAYDIEVVSNKRKLVLQKQPLLNWQNPERPSTLGSLFVWLDGTRPAAIASVFSFQVGQQVRRKHEIISLLPYALAAQLENEMVWNPEPADLKGLDVSIDLIPQTSETGRLVQMRSIAREFVGKHHPREGGAPQELRLLSQPLIRYRSEPDSIVDGAIFSLAVGTDPEIMLMVEARQEKASTIWKIVPLRSHFDALDLQYKGVTVWNAPLIQELMTTKPMQLPFAKKPFFVFYPKKPLPSAGDLQDLINGSRN